MFDGNDAVAFRHFFVVLHVVVPVAKANDPLVTQAGAVVVIFDVLETLYAAADAGAATTNQAATAVARTASVRLGNMQPE